MAWYKVADFPAEVDLSQLHQYFNQRGLAHRFTEKHDRQELWIADAALVDQARDFIDDWQAGRVELRPKVDSPGHEDGKGGASAALRAPLTLVLVVLGVLGYLVITVFVQTGWYEALTFQPFSSSRYGVVAEPALQGLARGEVWRLLTPTFLHFNVLHIVFNGLWIWEFGRRLELYFSTLTYVLIFLITAVGANLVQYLTARDIPFGGLSGVVYGYMGVLFVAHRIAPNPALAVPPGIFGFMLVWLALGVFGVIDLFMPGPGSVGNGAHLGGLLVGLILGYILFTRERP